MEKWYVSGHFCLLIIVGSTCLDCHFVQFNIELLFDAADPLLSQVCLIVAVS